MVRCVTYALYAHRRETIADDSKVVLSFLVASQNRWKGFKIWLKTARCCSVMGANMSCVSPRHPYALHTSSCNSCVTGCSITPLLISKISTQVWGRNCAQSYSTLTLIFAQ